MTFTIESDDDDGDILSPLDKEEPTPPIIIIIGDPSPLSPPLLPQQIDMNIVLNAFPDDHYLPESSCLLGERIVVGTVGFCGALALLSATCCCFCNGLHRQELANTHNKFTL
jgi:hypothetical protein